MTQHETVGDTKAEAEGTWVVTYDCGESEILSRITRPLAMAHRDDLGCRPVAAHLPEEVVLRGDPWAKNGALRCVVDHVVGTETVDTDDSE